MCSQKLMDTTKTMYGWWTIQITTTTFASRGCTCHDTTTIGNLGFTKTARQVDDLLFVVVAGGGGGGGILKDMIMKTTFWMSVHV
mmetsp:Transcript_6930/g.17204  ORF Transcript_6930/g.17204 Transcript_6930/m.17204 type:complete len:85 (-) Transcript_6930:260-514(-)